MRFVRVLVLVAALLVGCGPSSAGPSSGQSAQPSTPRRITSVMLGDPGYFNQAAYPGQGRVPGVGAMTPILSSGLTVTNAENVRIPQLGTEVPSTTTGSWKVFPDGRMETVSTIKPGALWHDGTPITAADLVFSVVVGSDKDLGLPRGAAFDFIEGAEARDSQTAVVRWTGPYISADAIFDSVARILPAHLLQSAYSSRANFLELSYWRENFVGTGPFKLKEWLPNSHTIMEAFEGYVLGRPRVDLIEVKFITDPNTVIANLLAGSIDMVLDGIVGLEQALEVGDRWPSGRVWSTRGDSSITIYSQFMDASPAVVANAQFRRALLMGMNRQALVDSFQRGQGAVGHTTVFALEDWEFEHVQAAIVRWPYEPRRAIELIQGLGYTRGPDGIFQDAAGQKLSVEMRTITREPQSKMVFVIADDWKQIGVETDVYIIPDQQASDREYRATFPAFQLLNQNTGFNNFHSREIPLPSNRYVGANRSRIVDAELTELADRFNVTIPIAERMEVASRAIRHMTDEVITMPTMYRVTSTLIANRVQNVVGITSGHNVHEWSVK